MMRLLRALVVSVLAVFVFLSLPSHVSAQATTGAQGPTRPDGWVVLAVADYQALRVKAFPPARPAEPPPVSATITRVEYDLALRGDAVVGQARVTADVFKEGWVSVPIPAGLRVREARIDATPVSLVPDPEARGAGGPSVLLSRQGRSVITLDLAVPVGTKAGTESIALPPSSAPVQRTMLTLGSADLVVAVSGGFVGERTSAANSTRLVVFGRPNEPLNLSWGRRREAATLGQPLRLRGAVTELVGLAEDSAQVSAQVLFEVVQGSTERVTIRLPPNFIVNQVSGALIADWQVRGDDCTVTFLEPVDQRVGVTVSGELKVARDGAIAVPLVRLAGVERETGGVAVEVLGAGEIKDRATRGLDPADATELGDIIASRQSPALAAFRFRPQPSESPRSLDLTIVRYTPQAVLVANIEEARYRALLAEDGKTLVEARYALRSSQRSFLTFTLPAGATLWSASVDGRPARPGRSPEGALLLPILRTRAAGPVTAISIMYIDRGTPWAAEGAVAIRLPAVDLPVSRTGLLVHHSSRFRLVLEPGPFRIQSFAPPESAALRDAYRGEATADRKDAAVGRPAPPSQAEQGLQDLASAYQRTSRANTITGLLPVAVTFPEAGESIYLATELAPESKSPEARFTFKRQVK